MGALLLGLAPGMCPDARAAEVVVAAAVEGVSSVAAAGSLGAAQAELGLAGEAAGWSLDVQLDARLDVEPVRVRTPWFPENLTARRDVGAIALTAGVLNPALGLEEWDAWQNYLPTWSVLFDAASPGRVAGAAIGTSVAGGEAFVYGGDDLDWGWPGRAPTFGAGWTTETDAWGSWSGVASYPTLRSHMALWAVERYLEAATVAVDGGAGVVDGRPWVASQVLVVARPDGAWRTVLRLEGVLDPQGGLVRPHDRAGSLGVILAPAAWWRATGEAKLARTTSGWEPQGTVQFAVLTPPRDE